MISPVRITEDEYHQHADDYDGLCVECVDWQAGGVEPDAEGYTCEACGAPAVMGTEQALICELLALE